MSFWDTTKFFDNPEIDNFRQFLYCLNENTNRGCSHLLVLCLIDYYGGYKELLENFSVDEVSQLISQLCTKQGEPMFKSEELDILIAAREFALSDDPKKTIEYLFTIQFELSPYCISNKY